jgi:hypothetical protein
VNRVSNLWQNVETHLHNTVTHLRQFNSWLEQYHSTRFETALKAAREFSGNFFVIQREKKEPFAEKEYLLKRMVIIL